MKAEEIVVGKTYRGRSGKDRTVITICEKMSPDGWIPSLFWEAYDRKHMGVMKFQGVLEDFASWAESIVETEVNL